MILSNRLKEHLTKPLALWVGTRDSNLRPEGVRASFVSHSHHHILRCFVQEGQARQTVLNMQDNGRVSLVSVDPINLESYQFKGTFIKQEMATEEDVEKINKVKAMFNEVLLAWGLPDRAIYNFPTFPAIAIEFEVEEIFDQTPKQGTGQRISELAGA